ncbi:MAG: hypothetical protein NT062_10530 [Proteobacteria bacterium]|nr:hypothetical protein [Pseudomonadota bacterium]
MSTPWLDGHVLAVVATLAVAIGCGRSATTTTPTATPSVRVRAEIRLAEDAERARRHDEARRHYQAAIAAAADPPSRDYAHHTFASTLISWGELDEATTHLEAAVLATPDDAGAWHDLGLVRHALGHDPTAIIALQRARDLRPNDPRPRIALAALQWKRGDRAAATSEYKALLALDLPDKVREKVEWALAVLAKEPGSGSP